MDVIEAILGRRSIGRVSPEEPSREMIEVILDAAVHAPNHHETNPWRFSVLTGKAREDFGDVLAYALESRLSGQSEDKVEALCAAERRKPLRAPILIVVGCKYSVNKKAVDEEDLQSCAAAIQNMLLTAHYLGLAAQWRTGDAAYDPIVKEYFGLEARDAIAGFIYIGFQADDAIAPPARPRDYVAFTRWFE